MSRLPSPTVEQNELRKAKERVALLARLGCRHRRVLCCSQALPGLLLSGDPNAVRFD
jgi:hypothetical protein